MAKKKESQDGKITRDRLMEVVSYNKETGIFTWVKPQSNRVKAGNPAGYLEHGYILIGIDGFKFRAHRLAWLYVTGEWPREDIDHRDMDRSNNAIANLRPATRTQNCGNCRKRATNTSGYKGVSEHQGRWRARIQVAYADHSLGVFDTKEEAHAAYAAALNKLQGEFGRTQ